MSNQTTIPAQGDFCWNELMTSDVKKAKEFYGNLFGWKCLDHDMGNMTYTMFKNGEKELGGMMQIPADKKGHMPPHWMSYIFVENLDTTVNKAQTMGAKITVPVTNVADFGKFAIIQDPTGANIALWQSTKAK